MPVPPHAPSDGPWRLTQADRHRQKPQLSDQRTRKHREVSGSCEGVRELRKRTQLQKGALDSQLALQAVPARRDPERVPQTETWGKATPCRGLAAGWRTRARSERTSKPLKAELSWICSPGKPSARESLDCLTLKRQNPQLKTLGGKWWNCAVCLRWCLQEMMH